MLNRTTHSSKTLLCLVRFNVNKTLLCLFEEALIILQNRYAHWFFNIQGISYWNVKSNLGLTDRNMLIGLCLKLSVWSWGLDIWVLSTNFQKSNIDWPQQPPIEKVLKFSKNFHDSVKIILVLRLLNSRTRITLKSSVVIFQALETSTAPLP